jgi:predicted small lipoprotein YifL
MVQKLRGTGLLAFNRLGVVFALAVLTATAFALAGCGRNGPPLPPPGATPTTSATPPAGTSSSGAQGANGPTPQQTAQKNGFDSLGNPVAPAGQKKSFLLDPLLMQ